MKWKSNRKVIYGYVSEFPQVFKEVFVKQTARETIAKPFFYKASIVL